MALVLFVKVAVDVRERDGLARLDGVLAAFAMAHRSASGTDTCVLLSELAAPVTLLATSVVGVLVLLVMQRRWMAGVWATTLAGSGLLHQLLKASFHRPRPVGAEVLWHNGSWSFPSGHTMGATVLYGVIAIVALQVARDRGWGIVARAAIIAGALLVIALVGASRVCLGVHFTTDVIAAWAAGAMWLGASLSIAGALHRRRRRASPLISARPQRLRGRRPGR